MSIIDNSRRNALSGCVVSSTAWLSVVDEGYPLWQEIPDNFLGLSVDESGKFGALIWYVTPDSDKHGELYNSVWLTNGPKLGFPDVSLVIDSSVPNAHDPASILEISSILAAVEEFCLAGTGDRPQSVEWIQGEVNGWRSDRDMVAGGDVNSDPWA